MKSLNDMMQLLQQGQQQWQTMQASLKNKQVQGESGAGLVTVVANGQYQVLSVSIDDSLLSEDKGMIESLVTAATNDAMTKVTEANQADMASMAAKFNMPPGFKPPF